MGRDPKLRDKCEGGWTDWREGQGEMGGLEYTMSLFKNHRFNQGSGGFQVCS